MAKEGSAGYLFYQVFGNNPPARYWSLCSAIPDLVPKFRTQLRLMGSFGLQGSAPWLRNSAETLCPLCKTEVDDNFHFIFKCKCLKGEWDTFWFNLFQKIDGRSVYQKVQKSFQIIYE